MKKLSVIVLTLVLLLSLTMTAYAATNSDGFDITLNPIGNLEYESFPQDYIVTGAVTYPTIDSNNGTVIDNQSIKLKFYVSTTEPSFNDNGKLNMTSDITTLADDEKITRNSADDDSINDGSFDFSFTWTINEPNTYYIIAVAKKADDYVNDIEEVEVVQQITASYPAAPAVAAHLLKEAGVNPRYGSGKTGGNLISDVADEMGPQTSFYDVVTEQYVEKSDVENYKLAVKRFLNIVCGIEEISLEQ